MKDEIKNCMATTGLALVILAVVATLNGARFLFISSVYQTLAANIVIHLGLSLLKRFECKYFIVEIVAELGYVLAVLAISGYVFGWYSSTPIWLLAIIGTVVYLLGSLINIFRVNSDVEFINHQLKLRKEQTNQII